MKKFLKATIILVLTLATCLCGVACGDKDDDGKTGLLYKKYPDDGYYTVYGYKDEGENLEVLDIAAYVKEKSGDDVKIGRIKLDAFKDNATLKEIIVPDTVETIDEGAFAGMKKLESITLPFVGANKNADATFNQTAPSADKAIDTERTFGYIFGSDEYDEGIAVSAIFTSGTENEAGKFYIPATLKNVKIAPKSGETYNVPMYAFAGNSLIQKVTLSGSFGIIGEAAFKDCVALETINIPASVTELKEQAFMGCTNLKNGFTFDENSTLDKVRDDCFSGCSYLSEITLPASLSVIHYGAFYNCTRLTKVNIGGTDTILPFAFYGCNNLDFVGNGAYAAKTINLTGVDARDFSFAESIDVSLFTITAAGSTSLIFFKA